MEYSWLVNSPFVNVVSLSFFVFAWLSYSIFSKRMAKKSYCLASILDVHRVGWMEKMLLRDNRVADVALIANLERNVNFFASTTMLIIAAILTALTTATDLEFLGHLFSHRENQYKLLVLLIIMIYAFFTFTWSLRQFGFGSVLVGAAPVPGQDEINLAQRKDYAYATAKVFDQAGHSFNYGLRAYYFSMAVLGWFIHPILFVLSTSLVVAVLYRREFHSKSLKLMVMDADILNGKSK